MSSLSDSTVSAPTGAPLDHTCEVAKNVNSAFDGKRLRSRRRAWWLPLLACVVVGALVAFGWQRRTAQTTRARETSAASTVPNVAVHVVAPATAAAQLGLPATLEPAQRTDIHARATGYVKRWHADLGQQVAAGQTLAEIETPDLEQDVRKADAAVREARASLSLAQTTAERFRELLRRDAVARQEVDTREAELHVREAELSAAEAAFSRVQELTRFQTVVAPFAGVITARRVELGDLVGANGTGRELFTLEEVATLRAVVDVPQAYARAVLPGAKAQLQLPEFAGRSFEAEVVRTAGSLNPATRSMKVELRIPNLRRELLAGAYVQVRFTVARPSPVVTVPVTAVRIRQDGPYVAVVDAEERIRVQPVKLGHDLGNQIEIVDGLSAGLRVVRNPTDLLRPGTKVHVTRTAANK